LVRFSLVVFLICVLLVFSVFYGSAQGYFAVPSFTYEIIGFLGFSTISFYTYLLRKISKSPQDFTSAFLLTLVLRFLLFAGFMLVIIYIDNPGANSNALFFMVAYAILTVVEVGFLYQKVMSAKSSK